MPLTSLIFLNKHYIELGIVTTLYASDPPNPLFELNLNKTKK